MPTHTAEARWHGGLQSGRGTMKLGSGAWEGPFSFVSRFQEQQGTNPEELIGAAHAGCFSMAFSKMLEDAGHPASEIHTNARVKLEKQGAGFAITGIHLTCRGQVPGISQAEFVRIANEAKVGCPVSKALAGTHIELDAALQT